MSTFPTSALVSRVQLLIIETFDVSEHEARNLAGGLVSLAEGWGSPEAAAQLDWTYRVKKDLGEKLRWRSEDERTRFETSEKQKYAAWDAFISGRRHA
jgi:hypothetical protein